MLSSIPLFIVEKNFEQSRNLCTWANGKEMEILNIWFKQVNKYIFNIKWSKTSAWRLQRHRQHINLDQNVILDKSNKHWFWTKSRPKTKVLKCHHVKLQARDSQVFITECGFVDCSEKIHYPTTAPPPYKKISEIIFIYNFVKSFGFLLF